MNYRKISPGLLTALKDYQEQGEFGLARHMKTLGITSGGTTTQPSAAGVFIHCDAKANLEHLKNHGIHVNQKKGSIRTAFTPIDSLDALSEDIQVEWIVPSRYLKLLMDVAGTSVQLPLFRSNNNLSGNGVIIGIVDSGIDPTHPAFQGRILRIWDQTLNGSGVIEGQYGVELPPQFMTISTDTNGHGTHVAGIASGDDATFLGVAPGANLLIVRTDLRNDHISDGVRYIFRVANEMGLPAVVNLSLGGHADAHDGSDPLSQIIDEQSGAGRIVCCAAGNEGDDNIHAQVTLQTGEEKSIRFLVPSSSAQSTLFGCAINGWYSGNDNIEVALQSPGGFLTSFQAVIPAGNPTKVYNLPEGRIKITTPDKNFINQDFQFLIDISNLGSPLQPGIWRLWLRGNSINRGVVDTWILEDTDDLDVVFTGTSVSDSVKIGSPGASASAVTVASYTTKVEWIDQTGATRQVGLSIKDISGFSSEGPLRNGNQKPDIAAPGAMIVSARSSAAPMNPALAIDNLHRVMGGTSMATPFVTGIVALLLERNGQLIPQDVKNILRTNSAVPGLLPAQFDSKWGFGLIDTLGL